jgi:membrane protein involved in colicin uptake
VEAARGRAKAKADRDAERGAAREARDAEREKAKAEREQARAAAEAAREKAKADKEAQELDDMADDFRRGRRGLSFEQQRKLIRAGRARMNGEKFELKARALALELDLLELDV